MVFLHVSLKQQNNGYIHMGKIHNAVAKSMHKIAKIWEENLRRIVSY